MTFEEAKKILKKEVFGIRFKKFDKPLKFEEKLWICNEKPEVIEALHILAKNGISVSVPEIALRIRSIIIKKMRAGEGVPDSVSDTPLSAAEGIKLQWKDNKNTDKNPALAEAASQFNDVLLDEQTKKIRRLGKEIARLYKIIHKKNLKIAEKDEVITDLGKELKAQKDLVDHISKLRDSAKINLNLRMKECEKLKDELEEANNLVKEVRKGSKEYCEYGIAAEKMIQKLANIIVSKGLVPSDVFEKCRLWANGYRFNPQLPELSEEEERKLNAAKLVGVDVAEEGADHFGVIVLCKDKENEEAAEELSKVLNDVIDRFLLFGGIITKEE